MKNVLLALLAKEPAHGYELKQTYQQLFQAALPPVNAGQIYTTLARLERDKLVRDHTVEQGDRPDKRVYELTAAGRAAVHSWLEEPVCGPRLRDEFFVKLMLARTAGITDVTQLIERQRREYLQSLRELNQLAAQAEVRDDATARLLVQGAILHLKADVEWLALCEDELG
jgi:DNA-binding PadR family transcriptional regulator